MSEPQPNKQAKFLDAQEEFNKACNTHFGLKGVDIASTLHQKLEEIERNPKNTSDVDNKSSGLSNS